ncbi:MAG: response regulator [Longimicrobiales bacterium]|nr:response regulator [Longimicrobiales bacterium]
MIPMPPALPSLVLVVDDDPLMRQTLSRLLRAERMEVVAEVDGAGALESVRLLKPDLVLMDVMMPGMSGLEVCRLLKGDPGTRLIPVLLLTGLGGVEDQVRGLEAGADDFLSKPPERTELLARVKSLLRMKGYTDRLVRAESVVLSLGRSIEGKDPNTEGHCERLASYGTRLGVRMGLDQATLDAISFGGFLHDIGKVAVPDAILLKAGTLTEDEWEVMKKHPLTGEHICAPVHSFSHVLPIIRHHHERWDGSGYPDGMVGEEIPVAARVLQTVDIFDALTTQRPYKAALPPEEAMDTMESEVARGWWDPACFEAFSSMVREAPPDCGGGP